jgi:uncharacterized membrane protein YedE/YeeE
MKECFAAFVTALIFGIGLGISGMTDPSKVIGFLDVTGEWDPSLMFVMIGAIAIHGALYPFIIRRRAPVLAIKFQIPTIRKVDFKLIAGAVFFGLGWGLGGFCPGPAIVSSVTGNAFVLVFVFSMFLGIYLHKLLLKLISGRKQEG